MASLDHEKDRARTTETSSQRIKDDIARFVAEPSREALQDLIRYFCGEFDQYELKEQSPAVERIAKTGLAMANSGGRIILFGIRDATLEPVGLTDVMSKQQVFDSFRSFMPAPLLEDTTLLDFDYGETEYEVLRGKIIQVLAIPDQPHAIPFVCENEWHKDDDHLRRGATYVRSGTNTREADYDQIQRILKRRIEAELPSAASHEVSSELSLLQALYSARASALESERERPAGKDERLSAYLTRLIGRKLSELEHALGFADSSTTRS